MHRAHPETFEAPLAFEIQALRVGHNAKLCSPGERFWVVITAVQAHADPFATLYTGRVSNYLVSAAQYDYGSLVQFEGRHVYDVNLS